MLDLFIEIGLLDETEVPYLAPDAKPITWNEVLRKVLDIPQSTTIVQGIRDKFKSKTSFPDQGHSHKKIDNLIKGLEWLGLLSEENQAPLKKNLLDSLCTQLQEKMFYKKGEYDMVLLYHLIEAEFPDNSKETFVSRLHYRGNSKAMAMAKTVGVPVGIAAQLILNNVITSRGVLPPILPDIYGPLLKRLEEEGIIIENEKY